MYKKALNHNTKWPSIPDRPNTILIIGGSRSGKNNVLLNLIKHQQPDFDQNLYIHQGSIRIKVSIAY